MNKVKKLIGGQNEVVLHIFHGKVIPTFVRTEDLSESKNKNNCWSLNISFRQKRIEEFIIGLRHKMELLMHALCTKAIYECNRQLQQKQVKNIIIPR